MRVGIPYSGCKFKSEVPVTREDEAIAFAVGVILGGGECEVFMDNSGLAISVNIIATFLKPYDIKVPMTVKVRHEPEHHRFMGKITEDLMRLLGYAENKSITAK
ncbi:hypothetical protein LCGC14_1373010 [marine sediment metagenome]|uniref:Uncharacterized protein n=1 Tax=marine sediment metagenome TaxID=412755 RepID=A0A0F9KQY3_9ZZZZ